MDLGGTAACALNAANEITVQAFLETKIGFLQIAEINEKVMKTCSFVQHPVYEDFVSVDAEARKIAVKLIE
jgi:1-deoxy-D-xylulose-5-phosphate reductoisomerase